MSKKSNVSSQSQTAIPFRHSVQIHDREEFDSFRKKKKENKRGEESFRVYVELILSPLANYSNTAPASKNQPSTNRLFCFFFASSTLFSFYRHWHHTADGSLSLQRL
jgi:hypothetical protein